MRCSGRELTSDMDFLSLALRRAQAIAQADATSGVALSNLASIAFGMGDAQLAWTTAQKLAGRARLEQLGADGAWAHRAD